MRTVLFGLALCFICLAGPTPDLEVVVPPSAAHPQDWLHLQIRNNPKPGYEAKPVGSLAEFVAPEMISKIVVDQYAGPADDVRRYLTTLPTAVAEYFGPSLLLCRPHQGTSGPALTWTSTSTVTFESGRSGRVAVASVHPTGGGHFAVPDQTETPGCVGLDKLPVDSLYVSYIDPDGYTWAFAI